MTKRQCARCHLIVHTASVAAAGIGLAKIPCPDSIALVPIETAMVVALGGVFGIRLSQSGAEATIATATATLCGRGFSRVIVGGAPPGVGNICNAATAALTVELLGFAVAADFDGRSTGRAKAGKKEEEDCAGHTKT